MQVLFGDEDLPGKDTLLCLTKLFIHPFLDNLPFDQEYLDELLQKLVAGIQHIFYTYP